LNDVVNKPSALRLREYETIYILRPALPRETAADLANRLSDIMTRSGATLTKVENWGRRRLAYRVQKFSHGVYVYLKYIGSGHTVSELERTFRFTDDVMKFQTVRLAEVAQSVAVDPSEIQFEHFDGANAPPLEEESLARQLGLDDRGPRLVEEPMEVDEGYMDDGDDRGPGPRPAKAEREES
jgi:small subunit ribosomal protein S6